LIDYLEKRKRKRKVGRKERDLGKAKRAFLGLWALGL